jgi:kynurenine formamidase
MSPTRPVAGILSFLLGAAVATGCKAPPLPVAPGLLEGRIVDLTHAFDEGTIYWPTETGFQLERVAFGPTPAGYFYAANRLCAAEHGGTHIDAPIHFHEDRDTVDAIPLERLIGPGIVVDASESCRRDPDYRVRVDDFLAWEERNGRIPEGAIVLLRTGFGRHWPDRTRYMGTAERGAEAVAKLHFPGLDPEAAHWLATERSIGAIGLDTPSIDHGPSTRFESHVALFARNIPALENVANLHELPETGITVIALPMKIAGGSGGPTRIVAVVRDVR